MNIKIEIPDYNINSGITYKWENNFKITVKYSVGQVIINANKEGLESLANHFLSIAQDEVPIGFHLHLDEYNSLEEGSTELIIEKA